LRYIREAGGPDVSGPTAGKAGITQVARMTPRIDKAFRREVLLDGRPYTVTITPDGVRIVPKGKRSGAHEMTWLELVSGEAELHRDLVRSLAHRKPPQPSPPRPRRARGKLRLA
jgi:hypothetical protein